MKGRLQKCKVTGRIFCGQHSSYDATCGLKFLDREEIMIGALGGRVGSAAKCSSERVV